MRINIISKTNPIMASDYTFYQLANGNEITLNGDETNCVNIVNKSIYYGTRFKNFDTYPRKKGIYGIRLVDMIPEIYEAAINEPYIKFFVVPSYEAYKYIKERDSRPVFYIDDVIYEVDILDLPKENGRIYTFFNVCNLDKRLTKIPNLDIYTDASRPDYFPTELRLNMPARFYQWSIDNIKNYNKYDTVMLSYNTIQPKGPEVLKSLNKIVQAFYFNQEVITNFYGEIHPDIYKEMKIERVDDEFWKICGNTRELYDKFFSHDVVRAKLINEINSVYG